MSQQQLSDILYAQWALLWPLNPQERRRVIAEVAADYEFQIQLEAVAIEMELV